VFERSPTAELNNCEIARLTGIPRTTVRDWVRLPRDRWQRTVGSACPECGQPAYAFEELPAGDCAYLLGIYLGDGTISRGRRGVWKLRIKMDIRYPSIIEECAAAVRAVMPRNRVSIYEHVGGSNAVEICSHSKCGHAFSRSTAPAESTSAASRSCRGRRRSSSSSRASSCAV